MAESNITHTSRSVARELVAPFTVYLEGEALAEFDTDSESEVYFQRLLADLRAIRDANLQRTSQVG